MVDRGGLNYPIRVRDEFSKTTALFRKELRASKSEFRAFQKAVGGKGSAANARAQTKAIRDQAAAQRKLNAANRAGTKPMTDREKAARAAHAANKKLSRSIAELARQQKARERTAIALRRAMEGDVRRENARVKALERQRIAEKKLRDSKNADLQATKRLTAAEFQRAVALRQVEQLKQRAAAQFRGGDIFGSVQTLKRARAMERSLKGQLGTAQKLLFTFRRLVGALAIFTLARRGVQVFNDLVKAGVQFNDKVETATLGIAGLVVTLGDVRDAQGGAVSATEQLNLALGVARSQTALLRQDSLKTVATFEQLLDTFQVSVGPGLAAGLNLDEVRQLTVDISQAAGALGVPQNQLAEEVRSLLSGTIQARTTRIATALGISNEDVRRLKETGELFDTLEEKFAGFNEAAQRQARETFSGISTLLKGIVQEVLGQAAQPLFQELIGIGNQLFDTILSVKDEAGKIRPNPEAVAAFQKIFDALKRAVDAGKELGSPLQLLDAVTSSIAVTIDIISGAVQGLISSFQFIRDIIVGIAEELNLTNENTGATAASITKWVVQLTIAFKLVAGMVPLIRGISGGFAIWVAALVAVIKGFEIIFSKVSGVNLTLGDTVEIISVSLLEAWFQLGGAIQKVAQSIANFFGGAIETIVSKTKSGALRALGFVQSELLFDDVGAQGLKDRAFEEEAALKKSQAARRAANEVELNDIQSQTDAKVKATQDEIALILNERRKAEGEFEGLAFDPTGGPIGPDGSGAVAAPPTADDAQVFGRSRVDEATLKKAQETVVVLQAQAAAERAVTDAVVAGLSSREMALVAATNAVSIADAELEKLREKNQLELAPLLAQRETLAQDGAELANLNEVIAALQVRQGYEEEILRLRREQLAAAQAEAEMVANGSMTDGLKEGFMQFAEQFSSTYNAGLEIAKQGTAALAAFASQAIVDAFDPTKEVDLKERFARLMQSIAQTILQQLIQLAIAKAILGFKDGGVVPEMSAGGVALSFAKGGQVPEHYSKRAQGLARGGLPRPGHIPASDTVPAWLTPGEFVMNKAATSQFLPLLEGMNGGRMSVVGSQSAEAAGPSTGMAAGGLVADQIAAAGGDSEGGGTSTVVVPAIVARDGEMDKLTAGGRNAMLAFMRENAGNINSLLDRSNGRG